VQVIIDAQHPDGRTKGDNDRGGWRYSPKPSTPTSPAPAGNSCPARRRKLRRVVPKSVLEEGLGYVKRCAVDAGGFGYQPHGGPNQARTGTGILSTIPHRRRQKRPRSDQGRRLSPGQSPDQHVEFYYYAVYYDSQALNQLGGNTGRSSTQARRPPAGLKQDNGSFGPEGGGQENDAGDAYRTSMACLALCVPFPISAPVSSRQMTKFPQRPRTGWR